MIMGDKNKMAALIVARVKPKADSDAMKANNEKAFSERAGEAHDEPGMDEGLLSASEEMISALHSKDPKAFALALKDFLSMADEDDSAEEEKEEDKPEDDKPGILG